MAKKAETLFANRIKPLLEKLPNTLVMRIQQVAIHGTPDYILFCNKFGIALELKKDEKSEPTELQKYTLRKVLFARCIGFVVHPGNFDEIYSILKTIAETGNIPFHLKGILDVQAKSWAPKE